MSVPTGQIFLPGPSLSYGVVKRRGTGVLLCFDNDLKLRFARRGLTDLRPSVDVGFRAGPLGRYDRVA